MPYAKVTYLPVDNSEDAEWCDKEHLMQKWEGLTKPTLTAWLKEMRERPEFKKGVLNPTHKIVFINKEVFQAFVEWKEATRYKGYKK
ncbi:excisionase [Lactococcus petauri]|uniref:excisionase n=1 Tax=Lactococcus petauri TaxID=1940789 RepID=UPI0018AAF605|nr:excisionase [Lactococcus petauri]MDC0826914.1 excisionase [Lactococcus petauri]